MKRIERDPLRFEAFSLYATYGEKEEVSLKDPASIDAFAALMKQNAELAVANEAFLHGQRTEALFARIVVELGQFQVVKQEDAGEAFHTLDEELLMPDFRIVLDDGKQMLVEVKNHYQGDQPTKEHREQTRYLDRLAAYATAMGCELRIATFWVKWNLWTLVPPSAFTRGDKYSVLSMARAQVMNEMGRLGDITIGTRSPLRLRVVADPSHTRTIDANGHATFTVGAWEVWSEDRKIELPLEQRIATYLILHGGWDIVHTNVETDGDLLVAVDHHMGLDEEYSLQEENGFERVDALSSMISRRNRSSTGEAEISAVKAKFLPGAAGALIPKDYKGIALPLWRFHMVAGGDDATTDDP